VKLHVDLETLRLIEGPGFRNPVQSIRIKRGDAAQFQVQFLTGGSTPTQIGGPDVLSIGFGVKLPGGFSGEYLVYSVDWTFPSVDPETTDNTYLVSPSFNTETLNAALGIGGENELAEISLIGEISWSVNGGPPTSTRTFAVIVENDVIRGTEGTPLGEPSPDEWLDSRRPLPVTGAFAPENGVTVGIVGQEYRAGATAPFTWYKCQEGAPDYLWALIDAVDVDEVVNTDLVLDKLKGASPVAGKIGAQYIPDPHAGLAATDITDSTAAGRALLTAATAAAQLTAIGGATAAQGGKADTALQSIPDARVAFVRLVGGNDATAAIGDRSKPFATVAAAYAAICAVVGGEIYNILDLGTGAHTLTLTEKATQVRVLARGDHHTLCSLALTVAGVTGNSVPGGDAPVVYLTQSGIEASVVSQGGPSTLGGGFVGKTGSVNITGGACLGIGSVNPPPATTFYMYDVTFTGFTYNVGGSATTYFKRCDSSRSGGVFGYTVVDLGGNIPAQLFQPSPIGAPVSVATTKTAVVGGLYVLTADCTFTDPSGRPASMSSYLVAGDSYGVIPNTFCATFADNSKGVGLTPIYRTYTGSAWVSGFTSLLQSVSGTNATLNLTRAHRGRIIRANGATQTYTVPTDLASGEPFECRIYAWAASPFTITAAGCTIKSKSGWTKCSTAGGVVTITRTGDTEWLLSGDLTAT
jgi:hypothetical protein